MKKILESFHVIYMDEELYLDRDLKGDGKLHFYDMDMHHKVRVKGNGFDTEADAWLWFTDNLSKIRAWQDKDRERW